MFFLSLLPHPLRFPIPPVQFPYFLPPPPLYPQSEKCCPPLCSSSPLCPAYSPPSFSHSFRILPCVCRFSPQHPSGSTTQTCYPLPPSPITVLSTNTFTNASETNTLLAPTFLWLSIVSNRVLSLNCLTMSSRPSRNLLICVLSVESSSFFSMEM